MVDRIQNKVFVSLLTVISICLAMILTTPHSSALTPLPTPDPKPGSYGLEATKTQAPPKQGARITTPGNGASFSSSPITVSGICPTGLLVQILNNNVMVGAVMCERGSFSVRVSLFPGTNELSAAVYDDLDQVGPKSNVVTVRYSNTNFAAFGDLVTLTSSYGRRAAPAGEQLSWPLQLSGGAGPYAFSIDWGDGSDLELKSQATAGVVSIAHKYKRAGIYRVNVTVTDVNGVTAFLQLIAVSSGQVDGSDAGAGQEEENQGPRTEILWAPAAVSAALMVPSFWLGRQSQLTSLRSRMLKERDQYESK